jgi:hypothetical protein
MRPGAGAAAGTGTGVKAVVVLVTVPRAGDREVRHHRGGGREDQQGGDERCHGWKQLNFPLNARARSDRQRERTADAL